LKLRLGLDLDVEDNDEEMDKSSSGGSIGSIGRAAPSTTLAVAAARSNAASAPSPATSALVPAPQQKQPNETKEEQRMARIMAACALVGAEVNRSKEFVHDYVGIDACYLYHETNNVDLVDVIRESFRRTVVVANTLTLLCNELGLDRDAVFVMTNWYDALADAEAKDLDYFTRMKEVYKQLKAQPKLTSATKTTLTGLERLSGMRAHPKSKESRDLATEKQRAEKKEKLLKQKRQASAHGGNSGGGDNSL